MIYFFYGEDSWSLRDRLKTLEETFLKKYPSAAIAELVGAADATDGAWRSRAQEMLESRDLFAAQKFLVIRDFVNQAAAYPQTAAYFLKTLPVLKAADTIIFAESGVPDKRLGFFKKLLRLATVEEFRTPTGRARETWIKNHLATAGFMMSPDALGQFLQLLGEDANLWQIDAELQKLMLLTLPRKDITAAAVTALLSPNLTKTVFDLTNLAAEGRTAEALLVLQRLLGGAPAGEIKAQVIQILGALASQLRSLLLVKDLAGRAPAEIARELNWKEGRVWINERLAKKFTSQKLIRLMHDLRAIDLRLKTSEEPPQLLLTLFLQKMKA